MPISKSFDELSQNIEAQEEEEEKINKNEKSSGDCINAKNQFEHIEPDVITSAFKNLRKYCRGQDVTNNDDATYWDEEVKDIMENMKKVHKSLAESARIDDVFRFRIDELKNGKMTESKDDLKVCMEEIEKMDAILKVKVCEEKQAKLSRIQTEEESRNILSKLPCPKASNGIKINLEEFMRLLNEVEKIEFDSSYSKENEFNKTEPGDGCGEGAKGEEKKEKPARQHQKNNKFVERNIQLAKCGRGTLSLTEEEKLRVEGLLADVEQPNARVEETNGVEASTKKKDSESSKELYGIDDETKSILSQIDEQLEMLAEIRKPEVYQTKLSLLEKNDPEEDDKKGNNKKGEKKERNRLKKINELLNSINSISGEEINPLTEEEIENLIRESKQSQDRLSKDEGDQCPQERITELVSNAKLLMPKFKYRFDEC